LWGNPDPPEQAQCEDINGNYIPVLPLDSEMLFMCFSVIVVGTLEDAYLVVS